MIAIRLNTLTNKIFLGFFLLFILFSFESQAKKVSFLTSSVVPAAKGYVKISRDRQQNYIVKIQMSGLKEVYDLNPSKLNYVVWMVTDEEFTRNMGKLDNSINLFTKRLRGNFETLTPFHPVRIFITAEDDLSRQYPGDQVVISTGKF